MLLNNNLIITFDLQVKLKQIRSRNCYQSMVSYFIYQFPQQFRCHRLPNSPVGLQS